MLSACRSYLPALLASALCAGCAIVPGADWQTLKSEHAALREENRAQIARIQNLESHCRSVEDQLMRTEEELALLDQEHQLARQRLETYQFDRTQLGAQFRGSIGPMRPLSPDVRARLADIARRYPQLRLDPQTGIAKLDTDILFDVGTSDLKPAAEASMRELVAVLQSPEARDLKVLVVGHTDAQPIARKPARDNYSDNFDLSADRAVAVCEVLEKLGLPEARMGLAGFGAHQPIAPNVTSADRQKNRRVELFVLAPEVPVIGWTETIPSVY